MTPDQVSGVFDFGDGFIEGTIGHSLAYQGGCFGVGSGGGPQFCNAFPTTENSNRFNVGLSDLPFIFPEASLIDDRYFVFDLLNKSGSPMWDGSRVLLPPSFTWGSRVSNNTNAPPNIGFPSQNTASSTDISAIPRPYNGSGSLISPLSGNCH